MQVSVILQVRDGFTGRILEGSNLVCVLDGVPVRPVAKPGGYLILTNLPVGEHQLLLRAAGYQDEYVEFTAVKDGYRELYVALKPGQQYLFRQSVIRLQLQLPDELRGCQIWISPPSVVECKIAQTKAESGSEQFRIFCKGNHMMLPIPGAFLIEDGEQSEVVVLKSLSEELGTLEEPLCRDHGRSRRLLPVQKYRCDEQGQIYAAFPMAGTAVVYTGSGEPRSLALTEGENRWDLSE